MKYEAKLIRDNFWAIEEQGVRSFLFVGDENAILVDTGFGGEIKAFCETLTSKPITLVTTHADGDHVGGDEQFDEHYMHPVEFDRYEIKNNKTVRAKPIWEGDVLKVGEYELEVMLVPGHTPGSIILLDRKHRFIISGDTVQGGTIFMFDDGRNLKAFKHSMLRLKALADSGVFDTVYASHGDAELGADIIEDHLILAEQLLSGEAKPLDEPIPEWLAAKGPSIYGCGRVKMYVKL